MQKLPGKMIDCTWQSTKTVIEAHRSDSKIQNETIRTGVQSITKEVFKSLGYAFACLGMQTYLFSASKELPEGIKQLVIVIGCIFYLRLLLSMSIGTITIYQGNHYLNRIERLPYFNIKTTPSPLLYFWLECEFDPKKIPPEFRSVLTAFIQGEKVECKALDSWLKKVDPFQKPTIDGKVAIRELLSAIEYRDFLTGFNDEKEIDTFNLINLLWFLDEDHHILREDKLRDECDENPFYPLAQKVHEIHDKFDLPEERKNYSKLSGILLGLSRQPSWADDPWFAPTVKKYHSLIQFLADQGIHSELLTTALEISTKDTTKLPIGMVQFFDPVIKTGMFDKVAPLIFGEPYLHVNLAIGEKVAGLFHHYYSRTVRNQGYQKTKRYKVLPNSSYIPLHLREEAENIYLNKLKQLALDQEFWTPLKHLSTDSSEGRLSLSYFPLPIILRLAAMSYFHRSPIRYWDPDILDLRKYRHKIMLCSQFIYVLIHASIKEVNRFLEDKGYPPHPYPADGKEILMGMTAWRIKYLLEKAGMLQEMV